MPTLGTDQNRSLDDFRRKNSTKPTHLGRFRYKADWFWQFRFENEKSGRSMRVVQHLLEDFADLAVVALVQLVQGFFDSSAARGFQGFVGIHDVGQMDFARGLQTIENLVVEVETFAGLYDRR